MSKKIVYTVISNGIDGREKDCIVYASENEAERDKWHDASKKNWQRRGHVI